MYAGLQRHRWVTVVIAEAACPRVFSLPAIVSDLMHSKKNDYRKANPQSRVTWELLDYRSRGPSKTKTPSKSWRKLFQRVCKMKDYLGSTC